MKFLRNKQLRQLSGYLALLTLLVFIAQYFFIGYRIDQLEESELKIEYTQLAQQNNQRITLQVQQFLNGKRDLVPAIAGLVEEQDFHLKTLLQGGRVGQRDQFISPLSRLPKITYNGLKENWDSYKSSILLLLSNYTESSAPAPTAPPIAETLDTDGFPGDSSNTESGLGDSVHISTPEPTPIQPEARLVNYTASISKIQYEGLSFTMSQWYDKLIADLDDEVAGRRQGLARAKIGILLFNALVLGGLYLAFITVVLKPLSSIGQKVSRHQRIEGFADNELGKLAHNVNETIENLRDATEFVTAIGKGDFTLNYKEALDPSYEPGSNLLADSLIEMQQKLRVLNEEEQKRQWANEGIAKFVDIMRSANDSLDVLGDRIISTLVHYTRSNQGGLYLVNDDNGKERYLELISLFAWDIKKHEQQIVKPGQGLLGQTYLEKETTYLTLLPEEYVRITSGLGGANPKAVLIVPLKVDTEVYGLVELASFNEFDVHEIAFVEKLGETIASTIASVRAAQKNKTLIVQFQQQTEVMKAQEEAMRQNMEELQATQEEITRKERGYITRIKELEEKLAQPAEPAELIELRKKCSTLEDDYQRKIEELRKELAQSESKAAHWQIAQEVHQTLKANLDAMEITRREIGKKTR